jgi:hypothetical protein
MHAGEQPRAGLPEDESGATLRIGSGRNADLGDFSLVARTSTPARGLPSNSSRRENSMPGATAEVLCLLRIGRSTLAALLLLASGMGSAAAEWSASAQAEYFQWRESTSPAVTERGPRVGLGLGWIEDRESGWLPAWRGRLYGGSVDYRGTFLLTDEPAAGTTNYTGIVNELQAIYRSSSVQYVGGIGWDYWERRLSARQKETYFVAFLRLGADLGARKARAWFGGGGIKYPLAVREDAHLEDIGFDQNPPLRPGRALSLYAELGYRFDRHWSLLGTYDSYRFPRSGSVQASADRTFPGTTFNLFQPESRMDALGLKLRYTF